MTYKIKYLPLAVLDLDALAFWLSRFYPNTLHRTMRDLEKSIDDLSSFPSMGTEYSSDPYYRKITCGNYLVFYHERVVRMVKLAVSPVAPPRGEANAIKSNKIAAFGYFTM